jgi:nucleoid-associated protein YgaU
MEKKSMKKLFLITVTVMIGMVFFAGCATTGVVLEPRNPTEQAFHDIYQRYRGDLILTGSTTHTVARGDTLANIARNVYGDGFYYPIILLASSNVVLDPDNLEPGMQLIIPDLQRNLNNTRARASIKSFLMEIADVEESRNRIPTANGIRQHANAL